MNTETIAIGPNAVLRVSDLDELIAKTNAAAPVKVGAGPNAKATNFRRDPNNPTHILYDVDGVTMRAL